MVICLYVAENSVMVIAMMMSAERRSEAAW
jgi:hypothetical protein